MKSLERKEGKNTYVMPDYVKIHEPKDSAQDINNIVPGVQHHQKNRDEQQ